MRRDRSRAGSGPHLCGRRIRPEHHTRAGIVAAIVVLLAAACLTACGSDDRLEWLGDDSWLPDDAVVVFQDDFDGPALDTTAWNTCHWWSVDGGCTIVTNAELEWYQPANVSQQESVLRLEARPESVIATDGTPYDFTSGMVTTGPPDQDGAAKFAFRYGGVEARVRVPEGAELWPAFWLLPASTESRPEIDIMEMHGDQVRTNGMRLHSFDASGERLSWRESYVGADFSAGWHTFALNWTPDQLTWLVDGVPVRRLEADNDDGILLPAEPLYMVLNLAVDSEPNSPPTGPDAFPAALEVDWVQVWQRPADIPAEQGS